MIDHLNSCLEDKSRYYISGKVASVELYEYSRIDGYADVWTVLFETKTITYTLSLN